MKRILLLVAMVVCSAFAASAQISLGESTVSAKVGVGEGYSLPITFSYEKALWEINSESCVTLGGVVGTGFGSDCPYFLVGVKSMYHYAINSWDLSAGATLGADFKGGADFSWGLNLGASYYFNDNWAASAELGYGVSFFGIGATYKF